MPVQQSLGTLNRLLSMVVIPNFPQLNITAPFCTTEGLMINFEGETTQTLRQLTGNVQSPEPFQMGVITAHILKTNGLANQYEIQRALSSLIGDVTAYPDTNGLGQYNLSNCSIANLQPAVFNGTDAGFAVTIRGTYYINSQLWGG